MLRFVVMFLLPVTLVACAAHPNDASNGTGQTAPVTKTNSQQQEPKLPTSDQWVLVQHKKADLQELQSSADQGHATKNMDPTAVALDFVNQEEQIKKFATGQVQDGYLSTDDVLVLTKDQTNLFLHFVQPVKHGRGGIWVVDRYAIQVSCKNGTKICQS